MRIAIDARMAGHSGIGRYLRGMIGALVKRPGRQFDYQIIKSPVPVYGFSEQLQIPKIAADAEGLHVPHYNAPLLWPKRLVVTIHDLIHLHFPQFLASPSAVWYARILLPLIVEKADALIAVSEHTKRDLITHFGVPSKKITVIYHGVDSQFQSPSVPNEEAFHQRPYFLYVGLLKAHKNIGILLDAFERLKERAGFQKLRLVLIGKADQKQPVVREWLCRISQNPSIAVLSEVSDEQLKNYYHHAQALILPSLYEGFGFPLLEAMNCRTPIIASRASSLPEIAGEAALYFDPHSARELESCLAKLFDGGGLRDDLIAKGTQRARSFDWAESARKTEQVYESVFQS